MHRRALLIGLASLAVARPAQAQLTPLAHSELKRLWQACERARDARQLMEHVPYYWGPLPWVFTGVVSYTGNADVPHGEHTTTVRVLAIRDDWSRGYQHLVVDYEIREPVRRTGARSFPKGQGL